MIDEDQGQSGRSAQHRTGFQRLLAEVTLEHVGLVLGLEMSRLARSSKDWHHLLELCALFGTLLGDQDGVYDPTDSNDRLLLGLKGTMSEFELFTMRNRLERGRLHKAERGELFFTAPMGYVLLSSGEIIKEPDEQARAVTQLILDKFTEIGTAYGVLHYLVKQGIELGIRPKRGPRRDELTWRRPTLSMIFRVLHHPWYAGAYAYGRHATERKAVGGVVRADVRTLPQSQWKVLKKDVLPAYITWEQYQANQERLRQNLARCDCAARHVAGMLCWAESSCAARAGDACGPTIRTPTSHTILRQPSRKSAGSNVCWPLQWSDRSVGRRTTLQSLGTGSAGTESASAGGRTSRTHSTPSALGASTRTAQYETQAPSGNSRRSSPRIAWWVVPWKPNGKRLCESSTNWMTSGGAFRKPRRSNCRTRSVSGS